MYKTLLLRYAIGIAIAVASVLLARWCKLQLKGGGRLARRVMLHIGHAAALCALAILIRIYAIQALHDFGFSDLPDRAVNLLTGIAVVVIVIWHLFLFIDLMEHRQIRKGNDPTTARLISRIFKVLVVLFFLLIFGDRLGITVSGLLAFGGFGGIVVGMASKDVLSNLMSGIMLFYNREFEPGDWISSPDRNIQGTVQEIGWRITKIMTFEHRPLYVPNSLFSSISVENPGRMSHRRIKASIGVRYEDASVVGAIVTDIRSMLARQPGIDQSQTMLVNFDAFAPSSLNILVYCFTKTVKWAEWLEVQQTIFLNIVEIIHQHDAKLALPSRNLHITSPRAVSELDPPSA